MNTIIKRRQKVLERIDNAVEKSGVARPVQIVAVTKTHSPKIIMDAINAGLTTIGENRVQEAEAKFSQLPPLLSLTRRMIGHLQSNKINKALPIFDTIDSVDSLKLARKLSRKLSEEEQTLPVLLEINTSGESSKYGFSPQNLEDMLACLELERLDVQGVMTIGPLTEDRQRVRDAFIHCRGILGKLNQQRPDAVPELRELSMGMSGDFELAIAEGSTMVRLGTVLFGPRRIYP